jgi:phospholipase C
MRRVGCRQWADRSVLACKAWADRVEQECREWADEGYEACSEWEEERHKDCCDWWPCSWACDAWVWISSWVCRAWYWVAKWVCVAWTYVVRAVCVVWGWITVTACGFWSIIVCVLRAILDAILSVFGRPSSRRRPKIAHIFVLMLENRSFDHMLGFSELTGTDAVTGAPTSANDLTGGFSNPDPNDPMHPADARVPAAFAISAAMKGPGHEFDNVVTQLCGADAEFPMPTGGYPPITNLGFVEDYTAVGSPSPRSIMNCYAPTQLPVLNQLAREFAVCDMWFSSMPGPTFPNRFFAHAASSGGLDDSPSGLEIGWNTLFDGFRFNNGTIFDLLDEACVDWEVVQGDEFPATLSLAGMTFNAVVRDRFTDFHDFVARLASGGSAPPYVFIEPHYGNILPGTSEDYTCGTSQHPLDDITSGERLIKETYEAIRNSSLWDSSVLIITWDEHGGFYDHVTPGPAVPPGDGVAEAENVHHGFEFDRLGPRVPAVVVSPLIPRNIVDHTQYDHASIPATLERNFGLASLTARDAAANDILHLLSLEAPRSDTPQVLDPPAESGFRCVSIFDLLEDAVITKAGVDGDTQPRRPPEEKPKRAGGRRTTRAAREAAARAAWEEAAGRKAAHEPGVRAVEVIALLREMSLLRRWNARGRLRAIERFRRRVAESDVRRYIADVRGMVRAAEGRSTSVTSELIPERPEGSERPDGPREGSA